MTAGADMQVLGIDAGGTKTVCYLADENGRLLGEGRSGGANLKAEGELGVEKVLHTVMDQAIGERQREVAAICLGMAGADRDDEQALVRDIMRRIGARARVVVVNDALVALVAGIGDGPGVVIISGTGSIAYGRSADRAARAGGWGHVLGDEGSGYWIGRQALQAVVRAADGRGAATALTPLVLEHFGVKRAQDLVQEVYFRLTQPSAIAGLSALVSTAAAEGDSIATTILDASAAELTTAALAVAAQLKLDACPVLLSGGVFRSSPRLMSCVTARLNEALPQVSVELLKEEPVSGAVRLALALAEGRAAIPQYETRA
jgi:N-acetylglucosamine kinase-like BadF-type ATPase